MVYFGRVDEDSNDGVVVVVVERTTSPRGKGNMASSRSAGTDGVVAETSYVTHALNWICRARTVMREESVNACIPGAVVWR